MLLLTICCLCLIQHYMYFKTSLATMVVGWYVFGLVVIDQRSVYCNELPWQIHRRNGISLSNCMQEDHSGKQHK